jgi:hypothetical protein
MSIITYGYEDAIFMQSLKTKNIIIDQISLSFELETSRDVFIENKETLKTAFISY